MVNTGLNECIKRLAAKEDSFYIYDESLIEKQIHALKDNFPSVQFLYSIKSNPNLNILNTVFGCGMGADAASALEVKMASDHGLSKNQIFYSAPGKSERDIIAALPLSTIIADSTNEVNKISSLAAEGITQIGLRINPDYSFESSCAAPSKFGIDECEALEFLRSNVPDNIRITGIHVHIKSQELNAEKLLTYYKNTIDLALKAEKCLGCQLDFVNLGSGIGIAYDQDESEIDMAKLGRNAEEIFKDYKTSHPHTRLLIESGRYVVCQSGIYVTHVADIKVSHGKTFVILQNTLNGFIRPSLALLVKKYAASDSISASEPLFTSADAFSFLFPFTKNEKIIATLTGNLCTVTDIIAADIKIPKPDIGDIVIINNAGAYASALSPMQFSSQPAPKEYMLSKCGELKA